ncbi:hypothetical protein HX001_16800 [Empedobacter brevis]|uniref:Uncharacterized protein n=1 Tax=Empedobacter brevis TaxID=247 RepID=A0AAJ1QHJ7_9FLAO|nr:hypothetical protein [Empedobacter brevis]MDM1074145.1 hypothetical protein [Empedobacter brevis]
MKHYNLLNLFFTFLFLFISCSKSIKREDLIGSWKSKDNQLLILKSDSSFEKKDLNLKLEIQKGRWKITNINDQNVLKLISEKESQTLYLEESFFSKSFTIVKWIGDPDDYNREEYIKNTQ